jgi:hypothetical protein
MDFLSKFSKNSSRKGFSVVELYIHGLLGDVSAHVVSFSNFSCVSISGSNVSPWGLFASLLLVPCQSSKLFDTSQKPPIVKSYWRGNLLKGHLPQDFRRQNFFRNASIKWSSPAGLE